MVDDNIVNPNISDEQLNDVPLVIQPDKPVVVPTRPLVKKLDEIVFNPYPKITIFDRSFWDLWIQKIFRNLASMKCQFLWAFFWTVIYGMYIGTDKTGVNYISPTLGLGFLSGGFITLVTAKLAVKTSLFESPSDPLDSDN
jgi:hypothetical protein